MLDRKWLISTNAKGAILATKVKRSGSDGVAPETSSITPAASARPAESVGADSSVAGLKSRRKLMSSSKTLGESAIITVPARDFRACRPPDRRRPTVTAANRCRFPEKPAVEKIASNT